MIWNSTAFRSYICRYFTIDIHVSTTKCYQIQTSYFKTIVATWEGHSPIEMWMNYTKSLRTLGMIPPRATCATNINNLYLLATCGKNVITRLIIDLWTHAVGPHWTEHNIIQIHSSVLWDIIHMHNNVMWDWHYYA